MHPFVRPPHASIPVSPNHVPTNHTDPWQMLAPHAPTPRDEANAPVLLCRSAALSRAIRCRWHRDSAHLETLGPVEPAPQECPPTHRDRERYPVIDELSFLVICLCCLFSSSSPSPSPSSPPSSAPSPSSLFRHSFASCGLGGCGAFSSAIGLVRPYASVWLSIYICRGQQCPPSQPPASENRDLGSASASASASAGTGARELASVVGPASHLPPSVASPLVHPSTSRPAGQPVSQKARAGAVGLLGQESRSEICRDLQMDCT